MNNPFKILSISYTSNDDEVKSAYLQQIRQFPPDRYPEKFKKIKEAYEKLKTERDRIACRLFCAEDLTLIDLMESIKKQDSIISSEKLIDFIAEFAKDHMKSLIQKKLAPEVD